METNQDTTQEPVRLTVDTKLTVRRFAVLFGVGLIGVLTVYPTALEQLRNLPLPPGSSLPALAAASLLTPAILLAVAVVVGLKTAPRLNLQSYLLDWTVHETPILPQLRRDIRTAVLWGLIAGVVIVLVRFGFGLFVDDLPPVIDTGTIGSIVATIPLRFLYGGITEELLLRWGFMSLVGFALFATIGREQESPSDGIMWIAILVSAVVFAIGHLPAVAATHSSTPGLITYIIVGNSVGGLVFGWLFWHRSLEAAIISHVSVHVVFVTLSIASLLVA